MALKTILVTGSSGLIGSEAVEHFDRQGCKVHGVDNNMRRIFFGDPGDTTWNLDRLRRITRNFTHQNWTFATALPWRLCSALSASI